LKHADIISLNLPLIAATYHLVSEQQIQKMKDGAIIINTVFEPRLDEEALVKGFRTVSCSSGLMSMGMRMSQHPSEACQQEGDAAPSPRKTTGETKREMEFLALKESRKRTRSGRATDSYCSIRLMRYPSLVGSSWPAQEQS
jgi:hypothetical protein